MQPYSNTVFMLLLNRLQSQSSPHFTAAFVHFILFLFAIDTVGADFVINILDAVQAG